MMNRPQRLFTLLPLVLLSASLLAQSVPSKGTLIAAEPAPNLGQLKTKLIAYHDCTRSHGCYQPELKRQSERAIAYLEQRVAKAKPGEKLAVVLDIDETSLSNWDEEKQDDFGYISEDWNRWVDKKQAPAIEGTLRLYNKALEHKVAVFFITGRPASQEAATIENLKSAGYHDWAGLAFRAPHPATETVSDYKSGERKKIAAAGYHIIVNVGDQLSDLAGEPQAELSVKLPNPFYFIP